MTRISYNPFHTLVQELAASRPGSWLLARILHRLDALAWSLSGQRSMLTSLLTGVPVVMVTTTGARSGLQRTSPLLPIRDPAEPGSFALIATNFGQAHFPSWYFNLKKNPLAACIVEGHPAMYLAHEAFGEEYDRFWKLATDTYFGYGLYKARAGRRIPIVILTPSKASRASYSS